MFKKAKQLFTVLDRPDVQAVLYLLKHNDRPLSVTEIQIGISREFGIKYDQPRTSQVLMQMRTEKLVKFDRSGKYIMYRINPDIIDLVEKTIFESIETWKDVLRNTGHMGTRIKARNRIKGLTRIAKAFILTFLVNTAATGQVMQFEIDTLPEFYHVQYYILTKDLPVKHFARTFFDPIESDTFYVMSYKMYPRKEEKVTRIETRKSEIQ